MKSFAILILLSFVFIFSVAAQTESDDLINTSKQKNDTVANIKQNSNQKYHLLLLADPAGFLLFGPAIHVEPIITKNLTLNGGIRICNLGLLNTLGNENLNMSYLFHGELKIFTKPKVSADGFFLGPVIEYGLFNYKSGSQYHYRIMGGEMGYRWISKKGLAVEIGDYIGLVQRKYKANWKNRMFIFYLFSFKIGKAF